MSDCLADELTLSAFFNQSARSIKAVQAKLDLGFKAYANLVSKSSKLFAVESAGYKETCDNLEQQIDTLLPTIDTQALLIRDTEDRPRIVIFPLAAKQLEIRVWRTRRYDDRGPECQYRLTPSLPDELQTFYQPLIERQYSWLLTLSEQDNWFILTEGIKICPTFSGLIPKETRTRIRQAISYFGEDFIYLLAEPTTWRKANEIWQTYKPSLIGVVAGWDGSKLQTIDVFQPISQSVIATGDFSV